MRLLMWLINFLAMLLALLMTAERAKRNAQKAAAVLKKRLGITALPEIGLVLGTGWGDSLKIEDARSMLFSQVPGFSRLAEIPGHARRVIYGFVAGKPVIVLSGRVHMNESPTNPMIVIMVRLQVQMLLELGVKRLILTAAVGSLSKDCRVGDVVIVDGFFSLIAGVMPLFAGEFCNPEDMLDKGLRQIALNAAVSGLRVHEGGHAMVRGPHFEGRKYDKLFLAGTGAKVVGMSILPECSVIGLYKAEKAEVLALTFVTDDDVEEMDHEKHTTRIKASAPVLGAYLKNIVHTLPQS